MTPRLVLGEDMEIILLLLPIVICVSAGYFLKQINLFSDADVASLTKILFWVIQPLFLFRTLFGVGARIMNEHSLFFAITVGYFATLVLVWLLTQCVLNRDNPRRRAISMFSSIRSNNVYLGLPICIIVMGRTGEELASIYLATSILGFQMLSIVAGEIGLSGTTSLRSLVKILKRLARNPLVIACASGIAVSILWARPLPTFLDQSLAVLSSGATGLALLLLGAGMRLSNPLDMLRDTWADTTIRMLIHPLIMWGCMIAFGISPEMTRVAVLTSAMPLAVSLYFMAEGMGMDGDYAARLIAATTVLGIVVIPAWMLVLGVV